MNDRTFRALFTVKKEHWRRFMISAGPQRAATVLREFVAWYIGVPGAKLPARPSKETHA